MSDFLRDIAGVEIFFKVLLFQLLKQNSVSEKVQYFGKL